MKGLSCVVLIVLIVVVGTSWGLKTTASEAAAQAQQAAAAARGSSKSVPNVAGEKVATERSYTNRDGQRMIRGAIPITSAEGLWNLLELGDKSEQAVVVMFYAPWCGHCKAMLPSVIEAAADLDDKRNRRYLLGLVDGSEHQDLMYREWHLNGFPSVLLIRHSDVEHIYPHSIHDWSRLNDRLGRPKLINAPTPQADSTMTAWRLRQLLNSHAVTFVFLSSLSASSSECPDYELARQNFLIASQRFHHRADFVLWEGIADADRRDLLVDSSLAAELDSFDRSAWASSNSLCPVIVALKDPVPDPDTGSLLLSAVYEGLFSTPPSGPSSLGVRLPLLEWIDDHRFQYVHKLTVDEWSIVQQSRYAVLAIVESSSTSTFGFVQAVKEVERSSPDTRNSSTFSFFWLDTDTRPTFVASMGCTLFPCLLVWETEEARYWRFERPEPSADWIESLVADVRAERVPSFSTLKGIWQHIDFYWFKAMQIIRGNLWTTVSIMVGVFVFLVYTTFKLATAPPTEEEKAQVSEIIGQQQPESPQPKESKKDQ